jgi:hypothetical protein
MDVPTFASSAGVPASVQAFWPQEFSQLNRFTQ